MRKSLWAVLLLGSAGCASISVSYDYDPQADFSTLRTYAWYVSSSGKPAVDSLTQQRIVRAVDDALATRGFQKVDGASPDFTVNALASVKERIRTHAVASDVGYDSWFGAGMSGETRETSWHDEGTLIVDVIAPSTKKLLWRGTAKAVVKPDRTPEEREGLIREAVNKILERFPPTKK